MRYFKVLALIIGVSVFLVGCGGSSSSSDTKGVICENTEDCDTKWGLAYKWIRDNSYWAIETYNDYLIATYEPSEEDSNRTAYQVEKNPLGDGKYQIHMYAYCYTLLIDCSPDANDAVNDFYNYITFGEYKQGN